MIYKPNPDADVLRDADAIETPIAVPTAQVDALHVSATLDGDRGPATRQSKTVTSHGQPFYAGHGLSRDIAAFNPRRTRRRTVDQLAAAALVACLALRQPSKPRLKCRFQTVRPIFALSATTR